MGLDSWSLSQVRRSPCVKTARGVDLDAPDPTELVLHAMSDVYESGENMFKQCVKIHPFTHSCVASREEMTKLAEELLPSLFPEGTLKVSRSRLTHVKEMRHLPISLQSMQRSIALRIMICTPWRSSRSLRIVSVLAIRCI